MKKAFFQLPEEKREKIISSCLREFGLRDFEKAALDRIVESAGISKGGLYEYITTKEELYLHIVELCYSKLYDFLHGMLDRAGKKLPEDVLERFSVVAHSAIDFYVAHPEMIGIISKTGHIDDEALAAKVAEIFDRRFSEMFDTVDDRPLAYDKKRVLDLLKWILAKTRNDFLKELASGADLALVQARYIEEWEFVLAILAGGVYAKR
jgi:TetR/AcrR family transcriptional regulator